jgi:sugar phosphate isomerase/epimerase
MDAWAVGLSTGCFYQIRISEVLGLIRDSGFSLLEISSHPKHLDYRDAELVKGVASQIRRLGLEAHSFHAPFGADLDITALDAAVRNSSVEKVVRAIEAASELGVREFVLHPGPDREWRLSAAEFEQRIRTSLESLALLCGHCRRLGVSLVLENMLPHLSLGFPVDLLRLVTSLDGFGVGICFDTGHGNLTGDPEAVVRHLSGRISMIHANDNDGRNDTHLAPGLGKIDWHRLARALLQQRFQGPFILELSGEGSRAAAVILGEAQASKQMIQEAYRKAAGAGR